MRNSCGLGPGSQSHRNYESLSTVHLCGSLAKGVFAESAWTFCRKFAEIARIKTLKNTFHCVRKGCGNSAEISQKFVENVLQ